MAPIDSDWSQPRRSGSPISTIWRVTMLASTCGHADCSPSRSTSRPSQIRLARQRWPRVHRRVRQNRGHRVAEAGRVVRTSSHGGWGQAQGMCVTVGVRRAVGRGRRVACGHVGTNPRGSCDLAAASCVPFPPRASRSVAISPYVCVQGLAPSQSRMLLGCRNATSWCASCPYYGRRFVI